MMGNFINICIRTLEGSNVYKKEIDHGIMTPDGVKQ
jgi:hypothetical protein